LGAALTLGLSFILHWTFIPAEHKQSISQVHAHREIQHRGEAHFYWAACVQAVVLPLVLFLSIYLPPVVWPAALSVPPFSFIFTLLIAYICPFPRLHTHRHIHTLPPPSP
jgi:hypothetical protein